MKIVYGNLNSFSHGGKVIFSDYISRNEEIFHINWRYNLVLHAFLILTRKVNYSDTVIFFDNRPRILLTSQEIYFHNALLFKKYLHLMPNELARLKGKITRYSVRYFGRNAKFFVQSEIMRKDFLSDFGNRHCVVKKVIPDLFLKVDTMFGLFPSRDIPHKGLTDGLNHLKRIKKSSSAEWKNLVIYVLGRGNNYSEENIQVLYIGEMNHSNTLKIMEKVDFVFFPSFVESLGLPLYEAGILNRIVIARCENFVLEYIADTNSENVVFLSDESSIKMIFEK